MGWVDLWVRLGRVEIFQFSMGLVGLGPLQQMYYNFERIMLMHLKHGQIRFGCTKQKLGQARRSAC